MYALQERKDHRNAKTLLQTFHRLKMPLIPPHQRGETMPVRQAVLPARFLNIGVEHFEKVIPTHFYVSYRLLSSAKLVEDIVDETSYIHIERRHTASCLTSISQMRSKNDII